MRIAVIGTGISGSLIARILSTAHDVHVYEASHYLGGHANTVDVRAFGRSYPVDTGFMVFNQDTYPNFCRLLKILGIASQDCDMSFSVTCHQSGLEYQGSSLNGLFAQRRNLLRPSFHRMLRDIFRFNRIATQAWQDGTLDDGVTVADFLLRHRLGKEFQNAYLIPMTAAIWSSEPDRILDFPAKFLVGFCHNHGLLKLRNRPQWKTICGGSRRYVAALMAPLRDHIRLNHPVQRVTRTADHVTVTTASGETELFDRVVLATHADQSLAMLADPTPQEVALLESFPYQENQAVLHRDTTRMPQRRAAWASWNYAIPRDPQNSACVTYDLSRLQSHSTPSPILLTLNGADRIDPNQTVRKFTYHHPAYSRASIAAQADHDKINGPRKTYFCGAYWGYGFHEDGVNSALQVARHFNLTLDACRVPSTKDRSLTAAATR